AFGSCDAISLVHQAQSPPPFTTIEPFSMHLDSSHIPRAAMPPFGRPGYFGYSYALPPPGSLGPTHLGLSNPKPSFVERETDSRYQLMARSLNKLMRTVGPGKKTYISSPLGRSAYTSKELETQEEKQRAPENDESSDEELTSDEEMHD